MDLYELCCIMFAVTEPREALVTDECGVVVERSFRHMNGIPHMICLDAHQEPHNSSAIEICAAVTLGCHAVPDTLKVVER